MYASRYLHELGIDATLHQGRHRFGTAVWASTKDMLVTQQMLRHRDPSTTAGYAAYDDQLAVNAMAGVHVLRYAL
jgi:integrase